MRILLLMPLFMAASLWGQSISLSEPKAPMSVPEVPEAAPMPIKKLIPLPRPLSFVEFRDAKLENVLKLIEKQSGLKSSQKKNLSTDLSLRLENVTWAELLKIIQKQVSP